MCRTWCQSHRGGRRSPRPSQSPRIPPGCDSMPGGLSPPGFLIGDSQRAAVKPRPGESLWRPLQALTRSRLSALHLPAALFLRLLFLLLPLAHPKNQLGTTRLIIRHPLSSRAQPSMNHDPFHIFRAGFFCVAVQYLRNAGALDIWWREEMWKVEHHEAGVVTEVLSRGFGGEDQGASSKSHQ